jgi:hypothetical protein
MGGSSGGGVSGGARQLSGEGQAGAGARDVRSRQHQSTASEHAVASSRPVDAQGRAGAEGEASFGSWQARPGRGAVTLPRSSDAVRVEGAEGGGGSRGGGKARPVVWAAAAAAAAAAIDDDDDSDSNASLSGSELVA